VTGVPPGGTGQRAGSTKSLARWVVGACAGALLATGAAGCGGTSPGAETHAPVQTQASSEQESPPPEPQTTPPPAPRPVSVATGVATDGAGDRAEVTVEMGEAKPMSEADETAEVCDARVSQQRSTPERSIAVPFTVKMTVVSSLSTDVIVNLNSFGFVQEGGDLDPNGEQTLPSFPLWAGDYSEGATCSDWTDVGNGTGTVHWGAEAASPHVEQEWSAWLVIPNAITPNDPTGAQIAHLLVDQPSVTLTGGARLKLNFGASNGLVSCYSEYALIPGDFTVMAQDAAGAISAGCKSTPATASVAGGASRVSTDAICNARYPSGRQRTVRVKGGTETIFDRQASLERVCLGFGAPEGLKLTPGMSCALIAAAATWGGPAVNAGTSSLCDTATVVAGYNSGGWAGVTSSLAESKACGYFSDVFAGGAGLLAAGAASETGPGAAAVGFATYKALASFLKVACGGVLDGGATALGTKLEADHETHVSLDITRRGRCLMLSQKGGLSGRSWHAIDCRDSST